MPGALLRLPPEQLEHAFVKFKSLADKKKEVFDEDIEAIVDDQLELSGGLWELTGLQVTAGSNTQESPAGEDILWWQQPFSASPEALVWVGAPTLTWKTIGNEVLKSAGIDDADDGLNRHGLPFADLDLLQHAG